MREYRISLEEVGYFLNDWNDAKDMTRILYASAQNCKTCMKIENVRTRALSRRCCVLTLI